MSELQQPTTRPVAPTQAPGTATSTDGAAEVYRRAVQAKPTGFAENPIGAMASAVDKMGKAAGRVVGGKAMEGRDGLQEGEARLKAAMEGVRANPGSLKAKQRAMTAGLALLQDMSKLAPNDPRRVKVSQFIVRLAQQLGPAGIPMHVQGMDVRGLLRLAAQTASRFGTPADMQAAFELEKVIKGTLPESSVAAVRMRDMMIQKFGLSQQAAALLAAGWAVREASPGEVPRLDMSARTMVLDATQNNPSLGVLARAYWHDASMRSQSDKQGFIDAFLKVANQGGFAVLSRKYKEVRQMARRELQQGRVATLGSAPAPVATAGGSRVTDESADMFASLAVFSQTHEGQQLPQELSSALGRFFKA